MTRKVQRICRKLFKEILAISLIFTLTYFYSGPVIASPAVSLSASPVESANFLELIELDERQTGFFSMLDLESEELIMRTARLIRPGDEYITSKNKLYRVERIEEDTAWARFQEEVKLFEGGFDAVLNTARPGGGPGEALSGQAHLQAGGAGQTNANVPRLGVYHSHGAESYVPSDGTESILEGGGILDVGHAFVEALREKGFKVVYSAKTHCPHDVGAYHRSRRTVENFLHHGVGALFDVHRDAVPAEEYIAEVENKPTVQVQIVVGQQNQNVQSNRNFAEGLKKVTDSIHPDLIKGIFMASGNYNQDIIPLSLLFEVGSHENTKEGAEHSMALFSDAISAYFLGAPAGPVRASRGLTALKSVLWIIFIAALALGVYLLVGTGSVEELQAKVRHFLGREFAEFGGKRRGGGDNDDGGPGGDGGGGGDDGGGE